MKYALRKLIAFVFLGGIFWFIYQDLDNLGQPWFMRALGLIALLFALFLVLVPSTVVGFRIMSRCRRNRARYDAWRAAAGDRPPAALPAHALHVALGEGESAYWHEKGTLYAQALAEAETWPAKGKPSDVAFPHFGRARYAQRTHVYLTNRRVIFSGRDLSLSLPYDEIAAAKPAPGGMIFKVRRDGTPTLAFTFQNPLIVRDVLAFCRSRASGTPWHGSC